MHFTTTRMGRLFALALCLLLLPAGHAQTVSAWLTTGNQSSLIAAQPSFSFTSSAGPAYATITLNPNQTFQSIEGLGFMLTQGSAQVIQGLPSSTRTALLNELFHPTTGLGISMIRISIGASDLSNSTYTYNQTAGDVNMNNFSLAGPDLTYLIPVLQSIRALNPNIKILATPWTAPTWMKTNNSYTGGSLLTTRYAAYALYFVKYLEAMNAQGIPIWGITPQNEPENPFNTPSMLMTASEQLNFINNHLGPAIAASPFNPKILVFDHNCDNTSYPTTVLNGSTYASGAAFHLYAGDISAMSTVRNATGKDVYFTEQYTDVNGNFSGDLSWHMRNVVIGSINNWSRSVLEWNLATDQNYGPRTQGGCTECLGALTINTGTNAITRNVSYYIIGQLARFAKPGAVRFSSSSSKGDFHCTALQNPDGSRVLLVYNDRTGTSKVKVVEGPGKEFARDIPAKSAMTFVWTPSSGGGGTPPPATAYYNIIARHSNKGLDVAGVSTASGANVQQWAISNGGGNNQRWRLEDAGSGMVRIRAKHSNMCLAAATTQNQNGVNVIQQTCNTSNRQKWTLVDVGGGYYGIRNAQSNRMLDVAGASTADGANVQIWGTSTPSHRQWRLVQVEGSRRANATEPGQLEANHTMLRFADPTAPDQLEENQVALYPNPTQGKLHVELPAGSNLVSLEVIDLIGNTYRVPVVHNGPEHVLMLWQELPAGLYMLRINLEQGTLTHKVAKY